MRGAHRIVDPVNGCFSRRAVLRLGGLVAAAAPWGFSRSSFAAPSPAAGRAKSCILVYLLGGPPHQDMFDLKPDAPAEVRGPFSPIATNVPGLSICEHLPLLSRMADKYALVRSVTHPNNNHTPMIYYTLTGRHVANPGVDNDISPPRNTDFPHLGGILARLKPVPTGLPGFVALPQCATRSNEENIRPVVPLRGGRGGFLGTAYDPLMINGDPRSPDAAPELALPEGVNAERFARRRELLDAVETRARGGVADRHYDLLRGAAVHMTGVAAGDGLYSLASEPPALRERYGDTRFGQSLLLARRLAEAGVPMIAIHFNEMTRCDGWDTHANNFKACQEELLPLVDQGLSALLTDLEERGTLDEVAVLCLGEFGRTPRINKDAGRDHWGYCSSAFLAGGGIRGGQVLGASDKLAAYPVERPVDPVDLHATVYRCLGLGPEELIFDPLGRPHVIGNGKVVEELL